MRASPPFPRLIGRGRFLGKCHIRSRKKMARRFLGNKYIRQGLWFSIILLRCLGDVDCRRTIQNQNVRRH